MLYLSPHLPKHFPPFFCHRILVAPLSHPKGAEGSLDEGDAARHRSGEASTSASAAAAARGAVAEGWDLVETSPDETVRPDSFGGMGAVARIAAQQELPRSPRCRTPPPPAQPSSFGSSVPSFVDHDRASFPSLPLPPFSPPGPRFSLYLAWPLTISSTKGHPRRPRGPPRGREEQLRGLPRLQIAGGRRSVPSGARWCRRRGVS